MTTKIHETSEVAAPAPLVRNAANCRWSTPTLWLAPPVWLNGDVASWACLHEGVYRLMMMTDACALCPKWEPRREQRYPVPR